MTWTEDALCYGQDPAIWFEDEPGYDLETARATCARCQVADRCLTEALAREKGAEARARAGVIAGTTPEQRVRMADKRHGNSLRDADSAERRRLYDMGFSDREIADKVGTNRSVICDWRKRQDPPLPVHDQAGQARRAQWAHLYEQGYPDAEIARLTRSTENGVRKWRLRMEYEPNRARVVA